MNTKLVTIVTGGSRGIGRAVALKMAAYTAVMVVGRTEKDLVEVCAQIQANGGTADYCVGDVSWPAIAKECMRKCQANGWSVRNLICGAAYAEGGACATFNADVWRHMFAVNVHGTFYFVQACLPQMIEQKAGNICVISSSIGLKGCKYESAYSATKHALIGFAKSVALENAKHNIVIVPICPGFVETDMTGRTIAGIMKHRGFSEDQARDLIAEQNPQKRILPAEEVADAVDLVCSGRIPALNGNPLVLTGGA